MKDWITLHATNGHAVFVLACMIYTLTKIGVWLSKMYR